MINDIDESEIKNIGALISSQINSTTQIIETASDETTSKDSTLETKLNETSSHKFYNFPKYYDKAFTRDVKSDIAFFKKCFQQFSDINVKRVLEPACGPGMFLEILPEFGFNALGYDLSQAMVDYAKEKLKRSGLNINQAEVVVGDMKNMKFDDKFDAAFICINSLGYLRKEEDVSSHFKVMGDSLKTNGIYIVEISCKCDDIRNEKKFDDTWYVREENFDLELTWAINWYDLEKRVRHIDFSMVINDNGHKTEVEEAHELRLWIFDEFKQFANSGGFEIVGIYNQNYERIAENIPVTGELGALFFILKKKS
ncbi:MAG: class I SAM-dependent methyltransferase [Candidatus Hodarchaeota archaeon]